MTACGVGIADERVEFYQLMSLIFRQELTQEACTVLFEVLTGDYFPLEGVDGLDTLKELSSSIAARRSRLVGSLAAVGREAGAQSLREEYYELFFNPAELRVSPWESSYANDDQLLFQESNGQVKRCYRAYGLEVSNGNFPGDHISTELDFLRLLAERERALGWPDAPVGHDLARVLDDHRHFIEDHPARWLPQLCRRLEGQRSAYYLPLAQMTLDACYLDEALINHG